MNNFITVNKAKLEDIEEIIAISNDKLGIGYIDAKILMQKNIFISCAKINDEIVGFCTSKSINQVSFEQEYPKLKNYFTLKENEQIGILLSIATKKIMKD